MAHCSNCGADVPNTARYCPRCGAELSARPTAAKPPPLPFSPWGPPPAAQTAGAGARAEPVAGPPLTGRQVGIAVGAVLLFLAFVILIGRGLRFGSSDARQTPAATQPLPVLGKMGEAIQVGNTAWGVAFTDEAVQLGEERPQRGKFFAVGVVIGNKSAEVMNLSQNSVGLVDEESGTRYTPKLTAWGTPDDISAGNYTTQFNLPANQVIAGLIVFDVPRNLAEPRLLVRDLAATSERFSGAIDLTQRQESSSGLAMATGRGGAP